MDAEKALVEACMLTEAVSPNGDPRKVINDLIDWHILNDRYSRTPENYENGIVYDNGRVLEVRISNVQVGNKIFDQIRVILGGLHLRCDLVNDLQIKAAKRIADDYQAWFFYDDHNADRVRRVLGINPD